MTAPTDADYEAQAQAVETAAASEAAVLRSWKSTPTPPPPPPAATGFVGLNLGDSAVWNQTAVFKDDFANLAGPGKVPSNWYQYPKGWPDTSKKGTYDPARASIVDRADGVRVLRQQVTVNSDGSFGGCVLCPASNGSPIYWTDMRYSERFKLEQQDNGHDVLEGWPAHDSDWETKSGEPDDVEYDTSGNPTFSGFVHVIGDSGDAHKVALTSNVKTYDAFHVVTIEQLPSKGSWRRYIDGKLSNVILNAGVAPTADDKAAGVQLVQLAKGLSVPGAVALRICKQAESNGHAPTKGGVIRDTDWVYVQVPA